MAKHVVLDKMTDKQAWALLCAAWLSDRCNQSCCVDDFVHLRAVPKKYPHSKVYQAIGLLLGALTSPVAWSATEDEPLATYESISIEEIEQKLGALQSAPSDTSFATFDGIYNQSLNANTPIARLSDEQPINKTPTNDETITETTNPKLNSDSDSNSSAQTVSTKFVGIEAIADLDGYIQQQVDERAVSAESRGDSPAADVSQEVIDEASGNQNSSARRPNIVKRLYNRFFNDGVESLERLKVDIYLQEALLDKDEVQVNAPRHLTDDQILQAATDELAGNDWFYEADFGKFIASSQEILVRVDDNEQPFKNIKAALENITTDSASDINIAMPRLRDEVMAAARAVGYYEMTFRLQDKGAGNLNLIIHELGEPVRVNEQMIDVRSTQDNERVIEQIVTDAKPSQGEVFDHGQYEQTKVKIGSLGSEYGFFDGRWLNHSVDVILPDNTADINLVYDAGEQYVFDEVVFFTYDEATGDYTTDPAKLPVRLPLLQKLMSFNKGDPFRASAVTHLGSQLGATNYFNATNIEVIYPDVQSTSSDEPSAHPNPNDEQAEEIVTLDDGTTAVISPIDFSPSEDILIKLNQVGNKADELLALPKNQILTKDNQNTSLLGRISNAVSSLAKAILPDESKDGQLPTTLTPAQFANKKSAQAVAVDKKVPLYVFVASDKPRQGQIGLGYGTDTGFRTTAKFKHNLLNNGGYQAGVDVSYSGVEQGVSTYVSRPLSHPLNDKLNFNLKYLEQTIDQGAGNFDLSSKTFEQGLYRNIIREGGWNRTYSLRYRLDELESRSDPSTWQDLPVRFIGNNPTQEALLAGVAFSKISQQEPLNPLRGYRQNYSLELASKSVLSDADMAILRAGIGGVYSFGDNAYGKARAHQLVGRLEGGYLWSNDFDNVPYKLRFFTGGDNSIRGYDYESLSPFNSAGYLMGGQALAVGSVEYNYEVKEGLRAAVFADVGNAYDKNFSGDTKIGAGIGVRYASPVGTVRVDLASPIGEDDTSIKLHFLIGLPF